MIIMTFLKKQEHFVKLKEITINGDTIKDMTGDTLDINQIEINDNLLTLKWTTDLN